MANVKISELPVAASVDGASSFPVVEGGVTKQVTFTGMLASPSLFASGMATFFATPSSANLRAALTDETGTGAAVFADSPTLVGPTVSSGNVTFSGTAQRITGDFSNATLTSRVAFQTSTTNGATSVSVLPNGSSTEANVAVFANSGPTNSAAAVLAMTSTDARVLSAITGSGTYVPLTLHTGGAERVRVDTSGNVLVGTTNTNVDTSDGIRFLPTGSAGASFVSFTNGGNGGTNLSLVNSNGSTTSWNAIIFQFNTSAVGSISCTPTTTAYNQSSDRRLKTAVAPAADAGALLDAVQVVEFDWKVGGHVRYGVIAQDLHLIAPEVVTPGDSNEEVARPWGVDYSKLVPMLIKEVQSLRARVAALEA
jgi:hypothetical protein